MNNVLDDEIPFSSGSSTVDRDPKLDKADATAALLRKSRIGKSREIQGKSKTDGDMTLMKVHLFDHLMAGDSTQLKQFLID
jgi:hypothetical protein